MCDGLVIINHMCWRGSQCLGEAKRNGAKLDWDGGKAPIIHIMTRVACKAGSQLSVSPSRQEQMDAGVEFTVGLDRAQGKNGGLMRCGREYESKVATPLTGRGSPGR